MVRLFKIKTGRRLLRSPVLLLLLPLINLCAAAEDGAAASGSPIKVGVILPLSGDLALFGSKLREGMELAVERSPGAVQLLFQDGSFENQKALSAFHHLTDIERVRFIIGPFGPGQTLSVAPLAQKKGVLLLAVSLCDPKYRRYSNVFCIYPSIRDQFQPIFTYLENRLSGKIKTLALFSDEIEARGEVESILSAYASRNQIQIAYSETLPPKDDDFRVQIAKMRRQPPDLLIVGGVPVRVVQFFKQTRELQLNPKYRMYASEQDAALFSSHKDLLEGVFIPSTFKGISPTFQHDFKKRLGRLPDLYQAISFDTASYLIQALQALPSADPNQVADYLKTVPLSAAATAGFSFSSDRQMQLKLVPVQLRGGEMVALE